MYRLIRLEPWEIAEHRIALEDADKCFYYMTYDAYSNLNENREKQTIVNLKIENGEIESKSNRKYYKDKSINNIASWIVATIKDYPVLTEYLWIPMQPSKCRSDKDYDDRLIKILEIVKQNIPEFVYFDALYAKKSVEKSHKSNDRDITRKLENLGVDVNFVKYLKNGKIVIFDDMLTTGASYKAAQLKIKNINNLLEIIGIFIAKAKSVS